MTQTPRLQPKMQGFFFSPSILEFSIFCLLCKVWPRALPLSYRAQMTPLKCRDPWHATAKRALFKTQ